jgi:hypothetical protein
MTLRRVSPSVTMLFILVLILICNSYQTNSTLNNEKHDKITNRLYQAFISQGRTVRKDVQANIWVFFVPRSTKNKKSESELKSQLNENALKRRAQHAQKVNRNSMCS